MRKSSLIIMILFSLLLVSVIFGGIVLRYYYTHYAEASISTEQQNETNEILQTGEGGWYQLYGFNISHSDSYKSDSIYIEKKDSCGNKYNLALLEFNISDYKYISLDEHAIESINEIFKRFKKEKINLIVRFLYDWDGNGTYNEPTDIKIIIHHIKQISRILNNYSDSIYTTQGILVGSWGEMHTSNYLSAHNMTKLMLTYLTSTNEDMFMAVRTPTQYRTILNELEKHPNNYKKYNITPDIFKKRVGLYNDGMLGSTSDLGTYTVSGNSSTEIDEKDIRREELEFQNTLCQTVPNGGEVINSKSYTKQHSAISSLKKMHVSYLNQVHDIKVIEKWRKTKYTGNDDLYNGKTVYDYISTHLGARMVIKNVSLSYKTYKDVNAKGTVTLENKGFSNFYKKKNLSLFWINTKTGTKKELIKQDNNSKKLNPCNWNPGEEVNIPFSFNPLDFPAGQYKLYISIKDSNGNFFDFANNSKDNKISAYYLGEIDIKHN